MMKVDCVYVTKKTFVLLSCKAVEVEVNILLKIFHTVKVNDAYKM